MTNENIILFALIVGIILGIAILSAVIYIHSKNRFLALKTSIFNAFGKLLSNMYVWQSVELKINADGGINLSATKQSETQADTNQINANLKIAKLENRLTYLNNDISKLVNISPEEQERRTQELQTLEQNSKYNIVILYQDEQENKALEIKELLLKYVYELELISTDFTQLNLDLDKKELKQKHDSQLINIEHSQKFDKNKLKEIQNLLSSFKVNENIKAKINNKLDDKNIKIYVF